MRCQIFYSSSDAMEEIPQSPDKKRKTWHRGVMPRRPSTFWNARIPTTMSEVQRHMYTHTHAHTNV